MKTVKTLPLRRIVALASVLVSLTAACASETGDEASSATESEIRTEWTAPVGTMLEVLRNANIYIGPSSKHAAIGKADKGTRVRLLEGATQRGFAYVESDGRKGFVWAGNLARPGSVERPGAREATPAGGADVSAADVLRVLSSSSGGDRSGGNRYCLDQDEGGGSDRKPRDVNVRELPTGNGISFTADFDIVCDGADTDTAWKKQSSRACGLSDVQSQTAHQDENGSVDAEHLSYFVLPPSLRKAAKIKPGAIGAAIYGDRIAYGVFADEAGDDHGGDTCSFIGEGSVPMAVALQGSSKGISCCSSPFDGPDVTWIVFRDEVLGNNDDWQATNAASAQRGKELLRTLVSR